MEEERLVWMKDIKKLSNEIASNQNLKKVIRQARYEIGENKSILYAMETSKGSTYAVYVDQENSEQGYIRLFGKTLKHEFPDRHYRHHEKHIGLTVFTESREDGAKLIMTINALFREDKALGFYTKEGKFATLSKNKIKFDKTPSDDIVILKVLPRTDNECLLDGKRFHLMPDQGMIPLNIYNSSSGELKLHIGHSVTKVVDSEYDLRSTVINSLVKPSKQQELDEQKCCCATF